MNGHMLSADQAKLFHVDFLNCESVLSSHHPTNWILCYMKEKKYKSEWDVIIKHMAFNPKCLLSFYDSNVCRSPTEWKVYMWSDHSGVKWCIDNHSGGARKIIKPGQKFKEDNAVSEHHHRSHIFPTIHALSTNRLKKN